MIGTLSKQPGDGELKETTAHDFDPKSDLDVRSQVSRLLHTQVASMNLDNFIVRAHRRAVEKFASPKAWTKLSDADLKELADEVASLPTQVERESEEAKRSICCC